VEVAESYQPDVSAYDLYLKGKSLYQTNRPEDMQAAEKLYLKALEIDPKYALAITGLSDVYAFQYMAYYDHTPQRIGLARDKALEAIEINPDLPEAHRSLARYFMFTGDMESAERSLLNTIDMNPKFAIGYRTLAWLKMASQEFSEASKWARKALELAPTDLETLLLLGNISQNELKLTAAIATLERAIELGPDYGRAYYSLGQVYMKLGALDRAQENFTLATKYKGDPNCCIDNGYISLIKKDYDDARGKFNQSIESGYFPFVANYYLGFTEQLAGNRDEARDYYQKAVSQMREFDFTRQENLPVVPYYALSLIGFGRREDAELALNEMAELQGLDASLYYQLGRGYAMLGKRDRAQKFLDLSVGKPMGPTKRELEQDPHFA
jgi:serine/threonine-protein kinase